MRIGVMVGPERGRYGTKVDRLRADARWAEDAGLASVWIPQIPDDFDALTAAAVVGAATSRIEIGTAVVPVQPRHPIALAQQALSVQAVCEGRLALGLGVSHHWVIDEMLGLPYERPVPTMRAHLDVLDQALAGPGTVDVENELFRVHNPLDITDITPTPVLIAALGPADAAAGRRAHRRDDPVDGRREGHRRAHRTGDQLGGRGRGPARAAGRGRHPGVPVRRRRGRRGGGPHEPHPGRGRDLPQLPEAPRPRRRPRRRRHPRRRHRGHDREAAPRVRRCRRHRCVGPGRAGRARTERRASSPLRSGPASYLASLGGSVGR